MDLFLPIILCVIFFILFSICGWCCKRKQRAGIVYGYGTTPVTVTTQHITHSQTAAPPYPMDVPHPVPQQGMPPGAPGLGFMPQGGYPPYPFGAAAPGGTYPPYSTSPGGAYPPSQGGAYPPPPGGTYPPVVHQLPPSYTEAVNQPPITEAYAKQAPYNPNY